MINRRNFLIQTGKAVGAAGVFGNTAWWFSRSRATRSIHSTFSLKDYSVSEAIDLPGLGITKGTNPEELVHRSIDAIGGIERFVNPGDVVLIKPDAAFARPPSLAATTNPDVVRAVVKLCVRAGAKRTIVTDHPIHSFERCFERNGIGQAVMDAKGELWIPSTSDFHRVDLGGWVLGSELVYAQPLIEATKLIGIPTAKVHTLCGASLAMKNWYGLLGEGRNRLHQEIHTAIADLCQAFQSTLIVLDATRLLLRNGPTGGSPSDVVEGHTVCCGTDPVAIDTYGSELLQMRKFCHYLSLAEERSLGVTDWRSLYPKEIIL